MLGSVLIFLCQLTGAVGLVINEFIIKKTNVNVCFETKNILIYMFGIVINIIFWDVTSFYKFDHKAWFISFYASLLGLSVGYLIKYTDSITKNLVGAGSLIITTFISSMDKKEIPEKSHIYSTLIVVLSMLQYYKVGFRFFNRDDSEI